MSKFLTLFKYELKKQFPQNLKKGKGDIAGFVLSLVGTLIIVGMCAFLMSVIAKNYLLVQVNKVFDKTARAYEFINLLYNIVLIALTFLILEGMRKSFTDQTDKKIFLRLPIKQETLFISKLAVLLLFSYISAFIFIVPINTIIFVALKPSAIFWLMTVVVWLFMPMVAMLIASIFIVPYIKLVDFLKGRYLLLFLVFSILLIGAFGIYILLLMVFQGYLETGFIRFLFNEKFINAMQLLMTITYPANCFAGIVLCKDLLKSFLVVIALVAMAVFAVYFISKKLFYITLYKNESKKVIYKTNLSTKPLKPMHALIKKEWISIARQPNHLFSYLVIATAMPFVSYCCFSLFESLINNMIGLSLTFELAIFVTLIFSVLTNTFCSTNITRDGISFLKEKSLPIKADLILDAKVIFCSLVSVSSLVLSSIGLVIFTSLNIWGGLLCILVGVMFSISQILVATKLDLKKAKLTATIAEKEKQSTKTIGVVILIGLALSMIVGIGCLLLGLWSNGIMNVKISAVFVYILPVVIGALYFAFAFWYYKKDTQKVFDRLTR